MPPGQFLSLVHKKRTPLQTAIFEPRLHARSATIRFASRLDLLGRAYFSLTLEQNRSTRTTLILQASLRYNRHTRLVGDSACWMGVDAKTATLVPVLLVPTHVAWAFVTAFSKYPAAKSKIFKRPFLRLSFDLRR